VPGAVRSGCQLGELHVEGSGIEGGGEVVVGDHVAVVLHLQASGTAEVVWVGVGDENRVDP
jgi:hypothetical protein